MAKKSNSFRVGKVQAYLRGQVWYLCYREQGRLTARIGLGHCTAPKVLRHLFATTLQEGRVDPLIRNELMGHVSSGERSAGHGLAMTAVYTHTRPQTRRQQLEEALQQRVALAVAREWLYREAGHKPK